MKVSDEWDQIMTVDVRFYVQASTVQEAVSSMFQLLPQLYPEPKVQTNVKEYDLYSVDEQNVYVNGFNPPYRITNATGELIDE